MSKEQDFYARFPELQGLSDDDWEFVIAHMDKDKRDTLKRLLFPAPAPAALEVGKDEVTPQDTIIASRIAKKYGMNSLLLPADIARAIADARGEAAARIEQLTREKGEVEQRALRNGAGLLASERMREIAEAERDTANARAEKADAKVAQISEECRRLSNRALELTERLNAKADTSKMTWQERREHRLPGGFDPAALELAEARAEAAMTALGEAATDLSEICMQLGDGWGA